MLCDTAVVGESLELDDVVAETLVLCDTAVVGEPLELDEVVVVWDTAVVGEALKLDDVVAVTLEVKDVVTDRLVVTLADGELVIACPAPTATKAMFAD